MDAAGQNRDGASLDLTDDQSSFVADDARGGPVRNLLVRNRNGAGRCVREIPQAGPKHERDLRMTKQEVKDEMKRMEGDPMIKQRRRQIAMAMSRDRQKKAVPTADVIVTNPTEYAVALKYDPENMHAPRVVAKGRGLIAAEIRRIGIENGVPILERPPLARALYKQVEVGGEIPEELYSAVAEILAYVYELTGRMRRNREMAGAR